MNQHMKEKVEAPHCRLLKNLVTALQSNFQMMHVLPIATLSLSHQKSMVRFAVLEPTAP